MGACRMSDADLFGWKAMPFARDDLDSNLLKQFISNIFQELRARLEYLCQHVWGGLHLGRCLLGKEQGRQLSSNEGLKHVGELFLLPDCSTPLWSMKRPRSQVRVGSSMRVVR